MSSATTPLQLKQAVKTLCLSLLDQRITTAREAMNQAQESANMEEKSSAGDKYETGRAMGQRERDMNARQLEHALRDRQQVALLDVTTPHTHIGPGSLFALADRLYFAGGGLGQIQVGDALVISISLQSPLYQNARGLRPGAALSVAGTMQTVGSVA